MGAKLISEQLGFSWVGLGDTSHIKRGELARAPSGRNGGGRGYVGRRMADGQVRGGRRKGAEKRFTSGRGCANLRRRVRGRGRGTYGGHRKWWYLAHTTFGTEEMNKWNWGFAVWRRERLIVEWCRILSWNTGFTRGSPAAFGWQWRRHRALIAAVLRFSTAMRITLPLRISPSTSWKLSSPRWWRGGDGGILWGPIFSPVTPQS